MLVSAPCSARSLTTSHCCPRAASQSVGAPSSSGATNLVLQKSYWPYLSPRASTWAPCSTRSPIKSHFFLSAANTSTVLPSTETIILVFHGSLKTLLTFHIDVGPKIDQKSDSIPFAPHDCKQKWCFATVIWNNNISILRIILKMLSHFSR